MEFHRKTLPAQPYLYVDREVPYGPQIAEAMGSAFAEVFGFVAEHGITPLGMPMSVYLGMDPAILRFRGGVLVSEDDAAKASGPIQRDTLPAGEAMMATHVGGYDTLNKTHQALWSHLETEGLTGAMPIWEIYVDDPGDTSPDELRTEIYRRIG